MTLKLTVATETDAVAVIEVSPDSKISTLSLLVQAELQILPSEQNLRFDGKPLNPSKTVSQSGLRDGDLVMVFRRHPASSANPDAPLSTQEAAQLDAVLANAQFMAALRRASPQLHSALLARDPRAFRALQGFLAGQGMGGLTPGAIGSLRGPPKQQFVDPMSADAQKEIEERIRMENVMENMEAAIEHNPESFGSVIMLFVDCKVNSVDGVKAFVDSGAQTTIISKACAERCNILRLLDTRFSGTAHGVGSAKIYGRIHLALLTLGTEVFEVSFTVMDAVGGSYDILLGLDMQRKHQACIDLKNNCLRIGNTSVPFLAEKDIPKRMLGAGRELRSSSGSSSPVSGPSSRAGSVASAPSSSGSSAGSAVSRLEQMGFGREESVEALRACNNDPDQAAAILLSKKYGL